MADWEDDVSASCAVGPISVSAGNGWPHNALRHHWLMPISCHFRDCKALLVTNLTHVSGAIASVQTFTFTFMGATSSTLHKFDVGDVSHGEETSGTAPARKAPTLRRWLND